MSDDIYTPEDLGETPEYNHIFRNRDLTSFYLLHLPDGCDVEEEIREMREGALNKEG